MDKRIISVLKTLYEVVREEENGCAEHICEYFSSKNLKKILNENDIQVEEDDEDENDYDG